MIDNTIEEMSPTFSARSVYNFNSADSFFDTNSTLSQFQDGTFGPYTEAGTVTNGFSVSA